MTILSATTTTPASVSAGLEPLSQLLGILRDPVILQLLRRARTVNGALRELLDLRPELELLPLNLLADELAQLK